VFVIEYVDAVKNIVFSTSQKDLLETLEKYKKKNQSLCVANSKIDGLKMMPSNGTEKEKKLMTMHFSLVVSIIFTNYKMCINRCVKVYGGYNL
jgi:hypothetical protein